MKHKPGNEKRFIQIIEDIDNEIIVSNKINLGSQKLAVYQYPLLRIKQKTQILLYFITKMKKDENFDSFQGNKKRNEPVA